MQAYVLNRTGGPAVLELSDVAKASLNPGEVRVRTRSIGLNYAEIQSRKGLYGWAPKRPYIPGMEAFGEIIAVAADVPELKIGDPVLAVGQFGCYSTEIVLPHTQILPAIPEFSPAENAAFAVQFMTAWVALFEIGRISRGEQVLIQAAAGGVGTAAVQLAVAHGCSVFGTTSSDVKLKVIEKLGGQGINYMKDDFYDVIREKLDGKGVDVVLEVVGGEVFQKSLDLLNPFGRLAVIGFASLNLNKLNPLSWWKTWRDIPRVKINDMALSSQVVGASHLGYLLNDVDRMMKIWKQLTNFVSDHGIRPMVGHEFEFTEIQEAHALMESRQSQGKIVLHVK